MKMGTKMADLKRKKRWNCSDGILNKKRNDHKMVTVFMQLYVQRSHLDHNRVLDVGWKSTKTIKSPINGRLHEWPTLKQSKTVNTLMITLCNTQIGIMNRALGLTVYVWC